MIINLDRAIDYKPRPPYISNGRVAWGIPTKLLSRDGYQLPEGWRILETTPKKFSIGVCGELRMDKRC